MATLSARRLILLAAVPLAGLALAGTLRGDGSDAKADGATVSLCDGESTLVVPGLEPGKVLPPEEARRVAARMMQVWRRTEGEVRWTAWVAEATAAAEAPSAAPAPPAEQAGQPTKFTKRDQLVWKLEQDKWVEEGYKNFHNAQALGGTIGISCDMCHPNGSNTHPETYPKYQTQLKKTALLRDMINWCIENPMKGKPLPEGDPRLRSVEAYILSARAGVALAVGKH